MTKLGRLWRLWRRSSPDPEIVRLHYSAPTVELSETAKLGPRWLEPDVPVAPKPIPDDLPIG